MSSSVTQGGAREAVYARWVSNWGARTPFTLGNEKFDPPAGRWARVTVANRTSAQDSLGAVGNRRFLRTGAVLVQLYDDVDNGMANLDSDSTVARAIFEGVSFSGLRFPGEASIRETGPDGEGKYQVVVEATFDYQEIK